MMHNAHHPYLFATCHGRVFRCSCCERVQVEFADLVLPVNRTRFEALDRTMKEAVLESHAGGWFRLEISTDAGVTRVPLRAKEVMNFHQLLSGAHAMLRLEDDLRAADAGQHFGTTLDARHP